MVETKDFTLDGNEHENATADENVECMTLSESSAVAGNVPVATEMLAVDGLIVEDDEQEGDETAKRAQLVGAGVCGGLVGILIGGIVLGAVAAAGTAYATSRPGAVGDVARAVGDVAVTAKDKAQEVNEKHHIVERTKVAAENAWEKAKEVDQQHGIVDKTKSFFVTTAHRVAAFNREHRVIERTTEKIGQFFSFLARSVHHEQMPQGHEAVPTSPPFESPPSPPPSKAQTMG